MAISRCLILPAHTVPITDASVSGKHQWVFAPKVLGWGQECEGVTLHLSGHGTALEGVGASSPHT